MGKVECHTFSPSQDIKQNGLLSFYLAADDVINVIYRSKAIAHREKKRERWKYKNLIISITKRAF